MGLIGTCLIQAVTLYGVNRDLSETRWRILWGQKGLVLCKVENYMGSIWNCLMQGGTLYCVIRSLSDKKCNIIWGQYGLV
jgi:hypothetical protein